MNNFWIKTRKPIRWFRVRSWPLATFISVSILITAPLFADKLADPVATMWGSALGALAAVSGALWVADRQIAKQQRSAALSIWLMFRKTTYALSELAIIYGEPSRVSKGDCDDEPGELSIAEWREISRLAKVVIEHHEKFKNNIHRYEAGLTFLMPVSLMNALDLESELEEIINGVVRELDRVPTKYDIEASENRPYPKAASWTKRSKLTKSSVAIKNHVHYLLRKSI